MSSDSGAWDAWRQSQGTQPAPWLDTYDPYDIPPPPPVPKDEALTNGPPRPASAADDPGRKDDRGKIRYHLIPPLALQEIARVLTYGGDKYGDDNWRKVMAAAGGPTRYLDAALRHIQAWRMGEDSDGDSGRHPLAHAIVSLMFLLDTELGL